MAQVEADLPAGIVTQAGEELASSGYLAEGRVWLTTRRLLFQAWPAEPQRYVQTFSLAHVEEVGMLRYRDPGQVATGRAVLWVGIVAVAVAGGAYERGMLVAHALAPNLKGPLSMAVLVGVAAIAGGVALLITAWRWCLRIGTASGQTLDLTPHPSAKETPAAVATTLSNLLGQG